MKKSRVSAKTLWRVTRSGRSPMAHGTFFAHPATGGVPGLGRRTRPNSADLLFEIGTEELPAAYLPSLIEQLGREAAALLTAHHLRFQHIQSFGTPRRLVLLVRTLDSIQRTPGQEVRGPSKQVSYDQQGKPTKALLGFLRSHHAVINQTKLVSLEKGEYVFLVKPPTTAATAHVLPALLPQLMEKLRAPKTMRWNESGVRFARPIRWLMARYGATMIPCTFGTLKSGAVTWVGLPKHPRAIRIPSVERYFRLLKDARVILNQEARRTWIERTVTRIAKQANGRPAPEMVSYGLLDEVTYLVEEPVPLTGQFDPKYLVLPREVLLASMAKHQRVFAIDAKGTLFPQCVAILEGKPQRPHQVRMVIERILNARLADSLMFWHEDHKRLPLEHMARDLSGVTFHERLGSMADKTQRIAALNEVLAHAWQLSTEESQQLHRACLLAKADLVSTMVKEFPTLQGVVGKYYAIDSKEARPTAQAIEEQYHPLGEKLPSTVIGSALAILDKYDTLAGYFSIGIEPTGDQDPFGLRRAASGIVDVGWKVRRALPLGALFTKWYTLAPRTTAPEALGQRIQRYILERLYAFAWPKPIPAVDCIDAVLGSPCDDLTDAMERITELQRLNGHPGLLKAAKVIERTRNILRGANLRQAAVDPAQLQEPPEQQLWELYRSNEQRLTDLVHNKSYAQATTVFGEVFFEPLHRFFDRVLVNVPEESLQQNRLALLKTIQTLYTDRIADLSKLTVLQRTEEPSVT